MYESSQVVAKIQIDVDAEIRKINPKNYDQKYTNTKQECYKYRKKLEDKRSTKWQNLREKTGSSSKQNTSSNAQNVDKDNVLLNVSHNNDSDCCDKKENLKYNSDSFLGTNKVSESVNVDSNNIQNEKDIKENTKRKVL